MGAPLLRTIPTQCIEYGKDTQGGYSTTFWTLMWDGTLQGTENKMQKPNQSKNIWSTIFLA